MNFDILRQKILEKAIRGELVPQLESEPEVVQIDRCPANAPFSIPKKWRWAYFSDVIDLISGRDLEKDKILTVNNGIPYITGASQIQDGNIIVNRWTEHPIVVSKKGDILLTCKGTIGKIAQNNIGEIHIARQIMAIRPSEKISIGYITYFLYYVKNFLVEKAKSMIPGIDRKTLLSMPIPLPPIEEQHRITIRLEGLFKDLSCAEKSFADLLTFTKIIKNRVLNKAIRGRLVPQLESEPDSCQIGKPPSKVPFSIPKKWEWVALRAVFHLKAGKFISAHEIKNYGMYPCYGGNGKRGYVDKFNREGKFPLIGRQGALCGNINLVEGKFYATEHAVVADGGELVDPDCAAFFLEFLNLNQYATKTAQPGLSVKRISETPYPLPPLAEQKRIAHKVQKLFKMLEKMAC